MQSFISVKHTSVEGLTENKLHELSFLETYFTVSVNIMVQNQCTKSQLFFTHNNYTKQLK